MASGIYSQSKCSTCHQRLWIDSKDQSTAALCGRCKLGLPPLEAVECGICFDPIGDQRHRFQNVSNHSWSHRRCSHLRNFCSGCLHGHVASRLSDNSWNIRCPFVSQKGERCAYVLVETDLKTILNRPEDKTLLVQYERLRMADHGEYLREILSSDSLSHSGNDSDSNSTQLDTSEGDCDSQRGGFEHWAGSSCQACPRCLVVVRKETGCDHMVCRCGTEFCFKCGGPYSEAVGPPCVCSAMVKGGCTQLGFWLRFYHRLDGDKQVKLENES